MHPAPATGPLQRPNDTAAQLRQLLQQQRPRELLAMATTVIATDPAHCEALLFKAIALRLLGHIAEAQQTLAELERHHPRFGRLHEERGRCFVALRQAAPAVRAFLQAVQLNEALPGSWEMLQGLYRMQGDTAAEVRAASHLTRLRALPQEVVLATALFADGDLQAAESLIRAYLLKHGDQLEAMHLLARIGMVHKVYLDAQLLLAAVLERVPEDRTARGEYAFVLVELHRFEEARREIEKLLMDEPDSRPLRILRAAACVGLGEHATAIALYRDLLDGGHQDADVHLSIGHAQKTVGDVQPAIASYRSAAQCRPDFGDAYWSLANLKTYRFSDEQLIRMRSAVDAPTTALVDRYHLCFAIGKALEDRREFGESYANYARGNALKHSERERRNSATLFERNTEQQIRICTRDFFAARQDWGVRSPDPIFIVGLPRAGSTLLEQILASHSQVDGTQELPNVQQMVSRLRGFGPEGDEPQYPRILQSLGAEDFRRLGEEYLSGTRVYRGGKASFIDKMPNNFRHLGLIHLMLPQARIIDARREPMACCFSNFKQLFANGQEFTYSIQDIARYYRSYLDLMRHWDEVLPGRVLRVYHEDVVDDLEGSVRRILAYCGLQFERQCIAFHETRRSVRTASSEQVRQAINRDGLEQWKSFEPWLGALREALGDALISYREGSGADSAGS
jgi:tetratricopeptide (TPR) repeat protein